MRTQKTFLVPVDFAYSSSGGTESRNVNVYNTVFNGTVKFKHRMNSIMKQWMLRLAAAFSMALALSVGTPSALAQGQPPAGGQPSAAEMKEMQDFQAKTATIQKKYMPQLDTIQKKYKPQLDAIEKKYGLTKYKTQQDAFMKEAKTMKPADQQGPKGMALQKKMAELQTKAKADPNVKKAAAEAKPITKKMFAEMKPLAKKFGDEILAIAPAKMKPIVKQTIDNQMKTLGG